MIELINKNPVIAEYLSLYPKSQWKDCLEHTLVVGIHTLQSQFSEFLSLEVLRQVSQSLPSDSQVPVVTTKLESIKEELHYTNRSNETRRTHRSNSLKKPKDAIKPKKPHEQTQVRTNESPKAPHKSSSQSKALKLRVPKHLQKIDSKIKDNIKKDKREWSNGEKIDSRLLGIADEFLKNPLISQLSHSQKEVTAPKPRPKNRYEDYSEEQRYSEISLNDL